MAEMLGQNASDFDWNDKDKAIMYKRYVYNNWAKVYYILFFYFNFTVAYFIISCSTYFTL